ncbi:hypothetical protein [Metaclostridioides mangenotii]|uniref:phage terminase large subunit family protein n=2 Tax=Metaclostridioides mangenotii TaxID=1540 RepID=UPI001FA770CB|nr:hypothetical protein [Clostridioides mangenotii]
MPKSIALRKEIKEINTSQNSPGVEFWNGSTIRVAVQSENSRFLRSHILILDEYFIMDKEIVDKVLLPTQMGMRHPGYKDKPEYEHIEEENKQIYLSSAGYTHQWGYEKFRYAVKKMLEEDNGFACAIPFTCALHHRMTTKQQIRDEMEKDGATPASFLMEYCAVCYNESDTAFFKSTQINPCRILEDVFIPPTDIEYTSCKTPQERAKKYGLPRLKGEKRIIAADIAIAKGSSNDNSVFTLIRMLPDGDKFKRYVVHIESHNGLESEKQAIRIKQLFNDFEADYIILDTQGVGNTVWSYIQKSNYDTERNEWYDAYTCFNEDNTVDKVMAKNAIKVVYSMKAYADINHKIATSLSDALTTKRLLLPINEIDAREKMTDSKRMKTKDLDEIAEKESRMLLPFAQTNALVNELINLEWQLQNGKVKIYEKSGCRKDRYSSLAYGNFLADLLEDEEYKNKKRGNNKFLFLN